MNPTTQHELRLAERMSRLGTETAFEVLNKARALERQGKKIIHLEIVLKKATKFKDFNQFCDKSPKKSVR